MPTVIVSIVVIAVIGVALYYTIKNRKKGACAYCSSCCSTCGGCSTEDDQNKADESK